MLRELIEREAAAVRGGVHALREWIHPTKAMTSDDVERRVELQDEGPQREFPDDEIDAHVEEMPN